MKLLLLSTMLCATSVLATIGGRCAGSFNDGYCICEPESTCKNYPGATLIYQDGNNHYPCPYDGKTVIGCEIQACASGNTECAFTDQCKRARGKVVAGNRCPGGDNFVCCRLP